jgi:hypothetical protein
MHSSRYYRGVWLFAAAVFTVVAVARTATAAQGDCSQPVSTGASPSASDCLLILQVAVDIEPCTPEPCVCDPSGDGNTSASDALLCLAKAVGAPVTLACPCSSANCNNNGVCGIDDDCVCSDCDNDPFCSDPSKCKNDGVCQSFEEGCVCADCATHPECLDN